MTELKQLDSYRWLVPRSEGMNTEGMIYASEKMILHVKEDNTSVQVANVATLPGIVGMSLAMPDIHWGYGFPIGGVAAFDKDQGVISPGGIGYDINCGVRLLRTNLNAEKISKNIPDLVSALFMNVPSGVGSKGRINLKTNEVKKVLENGSVWAVRNGFGNEEDILFTEEEGRMKDADPESVSRRALERGSSQLGTLGAGNHFLEIQVVEEIYDQQAAGAMDIFKGQVAVMIHCGSRGLGYQVCDDYLQVMSRAVRRYGINIPDKQLACAPVGSDEGKTYFGAMAAAANYAWANRQCIMHWTRETFEKVLSISPKDLDMRLVYDVAHNIGKLEDHPCQEKERKLMVHRKGATRAFPAGSKDIPERYSAIGQPVIIPGTMGTKSYIMVGTELAMKETWGSTCHGAGRRMSRTRALKEVRGEELKRRLKEQGITVQSKGYKTLAEEAPSAYKDVNEVVEVCSRAGISKKVARLAPMGVIKG